MLVLFESSAGYGLFKCDDKVLKASKVRFIERFKRIHILWD